MKDVNKEMWVEGTCSDCGVTYEFPYCEECEAFVETPCLEHNLKEKGS